MEVLPWSWWNVTQRMQVFRFCSFSTTRKLKLASASMMPRLYISNLWLGFTRMDRLIS
jgi:hypothetical protein